MLHGLFCCSHYVLFCLVDANMLCGTFHTCVWPLCCIVCLSTHNRVLCGTGCISDNSVLIFSATWPLHNCLSHELSACSTVASVSVTCSRYTLCTLCNFSFASQTSMIALCLVHDVLCLICCSACALASMTAMTLISMLG